MSLMYCKIPAVDTAGYGVVYVMASQPGLTQYGSRYHQAGQCQRPKNRNYQEQRSYRPLLIRSKVMHAIGWWCSVGWRVIRPPEDPA